jgi:hypothetical protein
VGGSEREGKWESVLRKSIYLDRIRDVNGCKKEEGGERETTRKEKGTEGGRKRV